MGDWLEVGVVEAEAQVDQLCTPERLALLLAEALRAMEAEVLTDAEPSGVRETLREAEVEPATLALPEWQTVAHAVALGTTLALRLLQSDPLEGTEAEAVAEEAREGVEE